MAQSPLTNILATASHFVQLQLVYQGGSSETYCMAAGTLVDCDHVIRHYAPPAAPVVAHSIAITTMTPEYRTFLSESVERSQILCFPILMDGRGGPSGRLNRPSDIRMPDFSIFGVTRIGAERQRQIKEKGFTGAHDDLEHSDGRFVDAAALLLMSGRISAYLPDAPKWAHALIQKHSEDMTRRLVIAGALIAAEIDRLERAK